MNIYMLNNLLLAICIFLAADIQSQQIRDTSFQPTIHSIMYPEGNGSKIHIDEAHNNFHTKNGRYYALASLLARDGYGVESNAHRFTREVLDTIKILVIANAEADGVTHPIVTPTESAFSDSEIKALQTWVQNGGALFLIADHMPFAGAAANLAAVFGFTFYDSFVQYTPKKSTIDFSRKESTLTNNVITKGLNSDEKINQIRTFTGQGFRIPERAISILNLDASQTVYLPDTMWIFNDKVETFPASNLSQGAFMPFGKGKLVVFGEAAMFTAQLAGPKKLKVGMNDPDAVDNYKLALNIIHWLDNKLE